MILAALDIGNTRTKFGRFHAGGELQQVWTVETCELPDALIPILDAFPVEESIRLGWMSVGRPEMDPATWTVWSRFAVHRTQWVHIAAGYPFPVIDNRYATPLTLGTDRIVAAIGAYARQRHRLPDSSPVPVLVIDAGTAITYDLITADGAYLGGGISPGLRMRFRALHEFTARLPLIEAVSDPALVGDSTEACIQSGVINGLRAEVRGIIEQYRGRHGANLAVYLTGGDAPYFEELVGENNRIFADDNLTLGGIHFILTQQPG